MTTNKMPLDALTARQIEDGWKRTFSTNNPFCPCNLKSFTKAVRWAEHEVGRAAIAALQAEPQPAIPEGWGFSSADFSLQASGVSEFGGVMLIRTGADRADWHFLTDEQREVIPLYVSGTGKTVAKAIASAAKNCTPLPTPPKD